MANEGNIPKGLIPLPDCRGQLETRTKVPVIGSNNPIDLFRGSPYRIADGAIIGDDWETGPDFTAAGAIVKLYDSTGVREVTNLPGAVDGYADVTYLKDQRYQVVASGTGFADDGSDNGKTYGLTSETSVANANGFDGPSDSFVMLDSSAEDPTANTFLASFKVAKPRNIGGADRTLIEGTINPACHQAW